MFPGNAVRNDCLHKLRTRKTKSVNKKREKEIQPLPTAKTFFISETTDTKGCIEKNYARNRSQKVRNCSYDC